MPDATLTRLLTYVGFGPSDEEALRSLHRRLEPRFSTIVDAFYAAIEKDVEASAVLADSAQVERLKLSLHSWLERILAGPWDEQYARLRERIGRVHVKVELPQRFMLTSMSVIRTALHSEADNLLTDRADAARCHQALAKILDVDLAIMLETYREDSMSALRRLEEVERKLLADELTVSEERYRAVLESAEVIAIAVARDGAVKLYNRHAELVSGRTRTEVLTATELDEIWHPSDQPRISEALEATRRGTASHVFEARVVNRRSETRYIRWHVTPLPPGESGEVCFVGIDLTAERELARRTRRAEELASLGTLAAGLAHEIRNPLNAAQLQLTLAERRLGKIDADLNVAVEPMRTVRNELDRLTTLVADFLDYARPAPLRLRAIDLRAATLGIAELMQPVAEAAGVVLNTTGEEAVTAQCDEQQCRQVLLNLVKNAIEAAAMAGRKVDLAVRREGPSSYVTVSDNGPGLPGDINAFEPFATSKEGGTGLGLSIVRRIVDQHGGTITVNRVDGRTHFEIELPTVGPAAD